MLENLKNFFKKIGKKEEEELLPSSSDAAKERLHLVLMQDRANVSIDFLDLMKQEIIDVIKKYIDIDEDSMDVRFTNQINEDGTNGTPILYANIPIVGIKNEDRAEQNKTDINIENKEIANKKEKNVNNKKESKVEDKIVATDKKTKSKKEETMNNNEIEKIANKENSETKKAAVKKDISDEKKVSDSTKSKKSVEKATTTKSKKLE